MEIPKFKKITKFDAYSVNEFVRKLLETRSETESAIIDIDSKIEEEKSKDTKVMSEEEKEEHKSKLAELRKEKRKIQNYMKKFEDERNRIQEKLDIKKSEIESKVQENEEKIQEFQNIIKENEEKLEELDQDSEEYGDLLKTNTEFQKKISRTKGVLTRYDKKINDILEIKERLEEEPPRVVEGLKPPRDIKSKARTLTAKERYKALLKEKEKQGYYAPGTVRTTQQNENFKKVDDLANKLKQENEKELMNNSNIEPEKPKGEQPKQTTQPKQSEQPKQPQQPKQTVQTPKEGLSQEELLKILAARQQTSPKAPSSAGTKPNIITPIDKETEKKEETKNEKEISFLKALLEKVKHLLDYIMKRIENLDKKMLGSSEKNNPTPQPENKNKEKGDKETFRESLLYKGYLKGKNAGAKDYYTPGSVRSEEQNSNFKKMDDLAKKLQQENEAELREKMQEEETK